VRCYDNDIPSAGHAGMETCIANLLEPGEKIVVGNNGIWGSRVVDMAGRYGGEHLVVKAERTLPAKQPGNSQSMFCGSCKLFHLLLAQRTWLTSRSRAAAATPLRS